MDKVTIQIENVGATDNGQCRKECQEADVELGIRSTQRKLDDGISLGHIDTHSLLVEEQIAPEDAKKASDVPTGSDGAVHRLSSSKDSASSCHSSWRDGVLSSFGQICSFVSTTKVFWAVVVYTIFGAYLFMWLEVSKDLEKKRKAYEYHLVVRDALLFKIEQIHKERLVEKSQHWKRAILEFEQHAGFPSPKLDTSWTLWMSILYCATIYTTVVIVVLDQLGTFLLHKMKELSSLIDDLFFFLGVKYHLVRLDDQEAFVRYIAICRILARLRLIPSTITLSITEEGIGPLDQKASVSGLLGTSSRSSSVDSDGGDNASLAKICKPSTNSATNCRERMSLRLAISRGSILHNIGPFYIESIDAETGDNLLVELDKQLLLPPTAKCQKQSARRESKASVTNVQIKLAEADKILLDIAEKYSSSKGETSRKTSATAASVHSETRPNQTPQLGKGRRSPPLAIALAVTTAWIAFAAAVFCLWEEWSYFTSIYFFFISMSTIGFGDVTPEHPQYMIMTFLVVVVGLSLVSVCINVVQEKVSLVYMDFLNKMLQQYMKAKESGDVEALKGAMAGFNDRCKYLMPFISKNQGMRIMNTFKEEAKAMGVELPEIMTELNEDTGKPTFCKIFDEKSELRVNQFLAQAQQQGKMRRNAHTQTKMALPKTHKFFISKAEANKEEIDAQTETDAPPLEKHRQTVGGECTDSGVQCVPIMSDGWTECVAGTRPAAVELIDSWTSPKSQSVIMTNTGVQPEVSCIMRIIGEDESDFPLYSSGEMEEEDDHKFAGPLSSSGLSRLGSPADALSSSQQSQMLSGSSREGELERRLSVSSRRSAQMKRMPEIELYDEGLAVEAGLVHSRTTERDVGQREDHEGAQESSSDRSRKIGRSDAKAIPATLSQRFFARPLSPPPPLVTIRMASKALTEEEIGEESKEMGEERAKKRRKLKKAAAAGIRYMKNAVIQTEYFCDIDGWEKSEEQKVTQRMEKGKQQQMMEDKWTQCVDKNDPKYSKGFGQSVGTQTDRKMKKRAEKGVAEERTEVGEENGEEMMEQDGALTPTDGSTATAKRQRHDDRQRHHQSPIAGENNFEGLTVQLETVEEGRDKTAEKSLHTVKCKRTQTDRPLLVSRPAQTQLSSTFRRTDSKDAGWREGEKAGGESEAQIGPHFEREKEKEEMKRVFGLDNEDIDELRQRVMQMKMKRREERQRLRREGRQTHRGESGQIMESEQTRRGEIGQIIEMNSSSEEEEQLDVEEKQILINEIRKMKRRKKRLEEEEEEEEEKEEEEKEEVTHQKRRAKRIRQKGNNKDGKEKEEEFTLQISHPPAERRHIIRENYEETILDIQLIRSPFFETRYLPQSEERMIFDEVEMKVQEPKRRRVGEEQQQMIDIEQLLNKLNKLETLSAKEEQTEHLESKRREIGQMSGESEEEIGQFTAETAAQTEEQGMANLWDENAKTMKKGAPKITEYSDEFKQFRERAGKIESWDNWTQTGEGWEVKEEEEERRQNVVKRVIEMWRGQRDRERGKTTADEESGKRNGTATNKVPPLMEQTQQQKRKQTIRQTEETEEETDRETKAKQKETDRETSRIEKTEVIRSSWKVKQESDREAKSKEDCRQMIQRVNQQMDQTEKSKLFGHQFEETKKDTDPESIQKGASPGKQRLVDLSQIVLVQSQPKSFEFLKMRKQLANEGDEAVTGSKLMPLEADELAQLQELMSGLVEEFSAKGTNEGIWRKMKEGQQQKEAQQTMICTPIPCSSTAGQGQFDDTAESEKEQKYQQQTITRMERVIELPGEGTDGSGYGGIRLIPLLNLLEGTPSDEGKAAISSAKGIQPWPIPPGPPQFGHSQLHYFRHWIENVLELIREKQQPHSLYDVPLKSISEFLRERRRELDELERQKQQLERLAELASREEIADRMVNVSIQAGVQSRVVPIMGVREEGNLPLGEEIDYLTNPTYPIVRVPLEMTEQRKEDQSGE